MFRRRVAGAAVVLLAAAAAHAQDSTLTVSAVQDTSVFFGTPGSEALADGAGDFLWLSVTAEGQVRRLLVKFDLSAVPPGSVVRKVTLTLFESRSREDHDVAVYRLLGAWGEGASNAGGAGNGAPAAPGDATWLHRFFPNTFWATPGGDRVAAASAVLRVGLPNTFYAWVAETPPAGTPVPRLVQDVQAWVDVPAANHGWILIGAEGGVQNAKRFESRNNATVGPKLTVVYGPAQGAEQSGDVPMPGWALGLLAALLAGGAVVRSSTSRRQGHSSTCHDRNE